jgi:hypothetical protein
MQTIGLRGGSSEMRPPSQGSYLELVIHKIFLTSFKDTNHFPSMQHSAFVWGLGSRAQATEPVLLLFVTG